MPTSTTITASDLGALFSLPSSARDRTTPATMGSARRPSPDRASRSTRATPPRYGRRDSDAWRPRAHADFLDGGAYPEIDVVQLPAGLGWGANAPASDHPDRPGASPPAALDVSFATLQISAARRALRLDRDSTVSSARTHDTRVAPPSRRTTAEYDAVVAFFARVLRAKNEGENKVARERKLGGGSRDAPSCAYANALLDAHPNARSPLRVRDVHPSAVAGLVLEHPPHGVPTIVSDAGRDWRRGLSWGFDGLAARLGDETVTCNDRAPARRADATSAHGKQRTCALPAREYLDYARGRPGSDDPDAMARADAPFYANGWRAFEASEASESNSVASRAFPPPYFASAMDHTRAIAEETHRRLLPRAPAGSAEATANGLHAALGKMFVGPAGVVTRMHQDAGEAHAWLGQVVGRKLFVCCPPDDAPALRVIEGETETAQSAVDPLDLSEEARVASAKFWTEARPVVFTLEPGEAAVIPRGWWHYAVAIDHGWTVMRNFYHAGTNAAALVRAMAGKLDRENARRS